MTDEPEADGTTEYCRIEIARDNDSEHYTISALPRDSGFKDPSNYDGFRATWIKINGMGFACDSAELSQHGKTMTIEQVTAGGSLHINYE